MAAPTQADLYNVDQQPVQNDNQQQVPQNDNQQQQPKTQTPQTQTQPQSQQQPQPQPQPQKDVADDIKNSEPADPDVMSPDDLKRYNSILSSRKLKRIYPGSKFSDLYFWKITPISQKESLLEYSISEYIFEIIRSDYTNIEKIIEIPRDLLQINTGITDSALLFQYYTMKNFLIEIGLYVIYLSSECTNKKCGKMQATTQYRYRCSAHRKPRDCSSIQYMIHTIDLFTERLNNLMNIKPFPVKKCKKDINDLCRRVYRIFAHSYFHHQELFEIYECNKLLCTRFIIFFRKHQLIPINLFRREIQIPNNALYYNRNQRKDKIKLFKLKQKQFELKKADELANARKSLSHNINSNKSNNDDIFMKKTDVTEIEADEVY